MFSTTPSTSTFTWRNISMALRTSGQRHRRRRGHQHRAGQRHGLDQAELHVAGARRQIHDQVIELAPHHAAQELLHDAVQHRPAPDHGLVARVQQAHGDHLQPIGVHGQDLPLAEGLRLLLGAEHQRHVGPVHVGIQQADRRAHAFQRDGQIHGDRRLAHAALAAGHGDEVLHAGNGHLLRLGSGSRRHGRHRILLLGPRALHRKARGGRRIQRFPAGSLPISTWHDRPPVLAGQVGQLWGGRPGHVDSQGMCGGRWRFATTPRTSTIVWRHRWR